MDDLKIKERLESLQSFKLHSEDSILRWKCNISTEESMNIVKEIGRMFVSDFAIDDENAFVYMNLVRWVNGDDSMQALDPVSRNSIVKGNLKRGIYLAGTTGSGKTLCMEIIKAYASIVGAKIQVYPNGKKDMTWTPIHATMIADIYTTQGYVGDIDGKDILLIEDFGCEPEFVSFMGNKIDVLKRMIEYRCDFSNKITMITTNLPLMNDLTKERYGNRVVSRLAELNYFELRGKDRRL